MPLQITPRRSPSQRVLPHTFGRVLLRAFLSALKHDFVHIAQSSAYSSIVALFPALVVLAAVIALLPDSTPLRLQTAMFLERVLPSNVTPLLMGYFDTNPHSHHSTHVIIVAVLVSLSGASGVIATLMEGFRRANDLPNDCWTFWQRRRRALLLVPISIAPMAVASLLVVFGHLMAAWLAAHILASTRIVVYIVASLLRWLIALAGMVGLISLLYHLGTPRRVPWPSTLPGAVVATTFWFLFTLIFGWYVTRFANYSQVYGSLGAGIALLFWLYVVSLCILFGEEFNAQFHHFLEEPHSLP